MRKFLLVLLFTTPIFGQNIYLSQEQNPAHPSSSGSPHIVYQGTYLPIIAIVTGTNDKGVHWTSSGGTLFNATCTANGPCAAAIYSATTTSAISVTATADANPSVSKTTWVQFVTSPVRPGAANVPQALVTAASLSTLQARAATGTNIPFNSMKTLANQYYNSYIAGGWTFTCPGGTTVNFGYPDDQAIYYFSFMALMGDTSRNWSCFARSVMLYDAVQIPAGTLPFGGNVWSDESVYFIPGMWWCLQSGAISSPADITTMRSFAAWAGRTINGYGYGAVVNPFGLGTSAQFNYGQQFELSAQRAMGNNYIWSKILWMVGISLMVHDDPTNDPLMTGADNTCGAARGAMCADFTAGSLHSYWNLTSQGYLLREWAHLEDPAITYPSLNAFFPSGGFNTPVMCHWAFPVGSGKLYQCFGDGIGGESAEGSWYSYSMYRMILALNLIHSSQYDDPLIEGPQVALINGSFWDMKMMADRLFMTNPYTQATPTGPAYGFLSTGDTQTFVSQRVPYDMASETGLLTTDIGAGGIGGNGRLDRIPYNVWFTVETAFGGKNGSNGGCTSHCGINSELVNFYGSANALDLFLTQSANDPTIIAETDPAPNYPTDWWTGAGSYNQHQEVRSGYGSTDTILSTQWSNTLINHEAQFQGGFDLWFNGGFITRRSMVFTDYLYGFYSTGRQNMVQLYDAPGVAAGSLDACFNQDMGYYGGQAWQDYQKDISIGVLHSEMPNYATIGGDQSVAQNGCWNGSAYQFNDVSQAYRDIIFLRNSHNLIWYDRDTKVHIPTPVLFLNTSANAVVSGNTASWTTASGGNKAKYTSLLPAGATIATEKFIGQAQVTAPFSSLQVGTTMQAACNVTYMDGTTANLASSAAWLSDNTGVATVSSTGLITAVGLGTFDVYCGLPPTTNMTAVFDPLQPPPTYSVGFVTVISGSSSGSLSGSINNNQTEDWENLGNLSVTPVSSPLDVRFLSCLDYGNSGYTPVSCTLVQSSSGDAFDGALFGTNLTLFKQNIGSLTGTTFPASGATTVYITDLTPGATYPVTGAGTPANCIADNGGTCVFNMTGTGNITVGAGTPPVLPAVFTGNLKGGVYK